VPDDDADADLIAAGPEPGRRPPWPRAGLWPGGLLWLIILAETVALAVAVAVAVHYHAQARAPHPGRGPAASVTTSLPMPEMTTVALALPADGTVTGTVVITAAALPGAGLVLAWIIGGYAIGRGLFAAVAMRRMPRPAAEALYRRARPAVLAQGCILAMAAYVPFLNLLIPVVGTAAMVHVLDRVLVAQTNRCG